MNNPVFTRLSAACEQERTKNEQKTEQEHKANEQNSSLLLFAVRVRSGAER